MQKDNKLCFSLTEGDNRVCRLEEFLKKVTEREAKCRNQ
jgi:hypothetical protein